MIEKLQKCIDYLGPKLTAKKLNVAERTIYYWLDRGSVYRAEDVERLEGLYQRLTEFRNVWIVWNDKSEQWECVRDSGRTKVMSRGDTPIEAWKQMLREVV